MKVSTYIHMVSILHGRHDRGFVSQVGGALPPPPPATQNHRFPSGCRGGAHSRHVCCATQQTCLLCHTADNVCCATQQTLSAVSHSRQCLLCETADIVGCVTQQTLSVVSHSRHCLLCPTADNVCCVPQQTCLLCQTADMSAVSHSRQACCVTQHACLLCPTADASAASHSRLVCCVRRLKEEFTFFPASTNSQGTWPTRTWSTPGTGATLAMVSILIV